MNSILCDIVTTIINFFTSFTTQLGLDMLFIIALGFEVVLVIFFLVKSAYSYEASLNRALDKLNYWLFEKKMVTEENIKDLNMLFKTKAPKRLCYYWQQYILFREGNPSSYLSTENLVEKPLKTSSYNSNIKNLSLISTIWGFIVSIFVLLYTNSETVLMGKYTAMAMLIPVIIALIACVFVVFMRARKNSTLNSLYQNVALFGRFMDNACIDLPSYIDYQILFTPQEIEKGQPVLREFLDYKARKEKEEFNKAKEETINHEVYDFTSTGVDGSIVLDRAMKESELFLKKKEKILVKISQLEAELDSRRKNFDNVQKDYQTKIQASKENITKLREMQEETTNRIESNYYRKQQTQEIAKQEQLEQEFEQLRAKYLLEKSEGEEEIAKLNNELEAYKDSVQKAMIGEYQTFFDKFCHSAQKVVAKVFDDKISALKTENEKNQQYITELEIKLKNVPQGAYDAEAPAIENVVKESAVQEEIPAEGKYDENGNYIYPNGTYYDKDGNFHDENGNVYTQDGTLISQAENNVDAMESFELSENPAPVKEEKKIVDFDSFDAFDFMTDTSQKNDIYEVAENIINQVDKDNEIDVINNAEANTVEESPEEEKPEAEAKTTVPAEFEEFSLEEEPETIEEESAPVAETIAEPDETSAAPKKKAGRPRKIVVQESAKPAGKRGRPKKVVEQPVEPRRKAGRPRKVVVEAPPSPAKKGPGRPKKVVEPEVQVKRPGRPRKVVEIPVEPVKRKAGRPKKIVKPAEPETQKRGRGRPKKQNASIEEINKKLSAEEAKLKKMRNSINNELKKAMNGIDADSVDAKKARREQLLKEIDKLQGEAQTAMNKNHSESALLEINEKLEKLLDEIKNIN